MQCAGYYSECAWLAEEGLCNIHNRRSGWPHEYFYCGKINYTPVYLLTALLILAAAATALIIRKQHKNKTDRPQK